MLLSFLGDLIPHGSLHRIDDLAFADLAAYLLEDDLTFANLESPLHPGRAPSGFPSFNAPPSFAEAAVKGGVDLFALANNHILDQGSEGMAETEGALRRLAREHPQLRWSGLEGWAEGIPQPERLLLKGYRIGFLSVTQFLNSWSEEPDPASSAAWTNDGYIYRVHLQANRETGELTYRTLELVPVTTAPSKAPGGRKVTTFPRAIAEAESERWASFYRRREEILREAARPEAGSP